MINFNPIETVIMGKDLLPLKDIKAQGFEPEKIEAFIHSWPKVPSEFKLQVVAEAIFVHFNANPAYAVTLSTLMVSLKNKQKLSAAYRLGKILSSWLHQHWATLPTSKMESRDAFRLFPTHALAAPLMPLPNYPFDMKLVGSAKNPSTRLHRPLEWQGSLDAISAVLARLSAPKRVTVIGFGDGKELKVLKQIWPNVQIQGFEAYVDGAFKTVLDFHSDIRVCFESNPDSYLCNGQPADIVLIRHPDPLGLVKWNSIVAKALTALTADGTLLLSFYSEKELVALKRAFQQLKLHDYSWFDCVNPFAYNPSFMSLAGRYTFDFYLAAIKRTGQSNPLQELQVTRTRKYEQGIHRSMMKYDVVSHPRSLVITSSEYKEIHSDPEYDKEKTCFACAKQVHDYFIGYTEIIGKDHQTCRVIFCEDHVPATVTNCEKIYRAVWNEPAICLRKYQLVGSKFSKPLMYKL